MKKKEYIEKLANLIVNRVRFHAPIVYDGEANFDLLELIGLDLTLPIFKYEKPLNKVALAAFKKAQEDVNFNLVTTAQPSVSEKKLKCLKNFIYIREEELGYSLLSSINAMNINYKSNTQFEKGLEENYIKVNGEIVNLSYRNYYLHKKASAGGVTYEIKEFLLNGHNYILSFLNPSSERRTMSFEINVVLPRGYYRFKRELNAIKIENLFSREVAYFNFNSKNAKFAFSSLSGIESSTHACLNMRINLSLNPKEQRKFYFNYGENKYLLSSPKEAEEFFEISQKKMNEIFDVKVLTRDKHFDEEFNVYMPQKIWLSWLNWSANEQCEQNYLKIKHSIFQKTANGIKINEDFKGLKQVQIYQNSGFKRVFIVPGNERYLLSGKTKYFNFNLLTKEIFEKNNEIYLSFGA